jgi:hypothetical protein
VSGGARQSENGQRDEWLAVVRDVSDSVRVEGEPHLVAGLVLDMGTGLIRGVAVGPTDAEALVAAFQNGLTKPAGELPPARPSLVLCGPGLEGAVRKAWASIPAGGIMPPLREVEPPADAEDIFDSFIGHMAGRSQPEDLPTPGDWALLFGAALEFYRSKPWDRWHDAITLELEVKVGGHRHRYAAVVMGNAGLEYGLVLYPGDEVPAGLEDWRPGQDVPMPPGTLVCSLTAPSELPADIRDKAARYGWPEGADLVPALMHLGPPGEAGDPGSEDVQLLAVALSGVTAHDARGPVAAGPREATTGSVVLADGRRARFSLRQRPTAPAPDGPQLRVHEAGFDLVPEGTPVVLGHLPWESLISLRTEAEIHRTFPTNAPRPSGREAPLVAILPNRRRGAAVAAKTAQLDPYGISIVVTDDGHAMVVLVGGEGAQIVAEVDADSPSVAAFHRRMRATKGLHVVMVADEATSRGEGTVYGLFECHQPQSDPVTTRSPTQRKPPKRRK